MSLLEHMHNKPHYVRRHYALLISFIITGIIAGIWVTTLPSRFAERPLTPKLPEKSEEVRELGDLLKDTKSQLGTVIETQKEIAKNLDEAKNLESLAIENAFLSTSTPATSTAATLVSTTSAMNALYAPTTQDNSTVIPIPESSEVIEVKTPPAQVAPFGGEGKVIQIETRKIQNNTILIGTTTSKISN